LVGLRLRIALPGLLERFSSDSIARADGHSMGCGGNCQLGILLFTEVHGETFSPGMLNRLSRRAGSWLRLVL
jgi:hypothetical protein